MSRPKYETKADLLNESRGISLVARWAGGMPRKLPDFHAADAAIVVGNEIVGFVEYKRRRMRWGDYPTIMLSASKFLNIEALARLGTDRKPMFVYFAVEDNAGDVWVVNLAADGLKLRCEWGGRTVKTRDDLDVEPVVHLYIDQFRRVGNVETGF
jgi:hypothetical protein